MSRFVVFVLAAAAGVAIYLGFFAPKPRAPRLAPEGTFFLTQYVSVRTAHGVAGIAAGEMVRRMDGPTSAGLVRVTDGNSCLDVPANLLTNDLDLAENLAARDQETQRSLSETIARTQAQLRQEASLTDAVHARNVSNYDAAMRQASAVGSLQSSLTAPVSHREVSWASGPSYGGTVFTTGASSSAPRYVPPPHWNPAK